MEHMNILCGQKAEIFINIKATGSNNCHCALIGLNFCHSRGTGSQCTDKQETYNLHLDMSVTLQVWRLLLILHEQLKGGVRAGRNRIAVQYDAESISGHSEFYVQRIGTNSQRH
jgi:hypothetical protein